MLKSYNWLDGMGRMEILCKHLLQHLSAVLIMGIMMAMLMISNLGSMCEVIIGDGIVWGLPYGSNISPMPLYSPYHHHHHIYLHYANRNIELFTNQNVQKANLVSESCSDVKPVRVNGHTEDHNYILHFIQGRYREPT